MQTGPAEKPEPGGPPRVSRGAGPPTSAGWPGSPGTAGPPARPHNLREIEGDGNALGRTKITIN